ncbi:hypothetical protein OTU49_001937 [Cherax quadricarinatus]
MELERQRTRLEKLKGKKEGSSSHPITDKKPYSWCSEPFTVVGEECFYLSQTVKLAWHDAGTACDTMGAHLAHPSDLTLLATHLKNFRSQKIRYWLGASDEALEGEWRWVTGGTVVADWRPDNVSRQGEVQDCLTLLLSKHRPPSLDDYSCWKKRNFICQLDIHC